jgi:phospholipid transport system substrate-binding protein
MPLVFLFSVLIVAAPVAAEAQNVPNSVMSPEQAQQSPAGKFVQDLGNQGVAIAADKSLSEDQRRSKYNQLLIQAFDTPTIGRFALGPAWNNATADQQQEYLKTFQEMVVKMYGDKLNFYSGESFQVKSVRPEDEKDTIVASNINHPEGTPPTPVDWRVRQVNGAYKIIDVSVEGVSQSITQRQEFASILQRNSGNIDILIKMMHERAESPPPQPGPS